MLLEKKREKLIDLGFVILMAYFFSEVIPAFISYEGMGSILMKLAPSVLILVLFLFYKYAERPIFSTRFFTKDTFTPKSFSIASSIAILVAISCLNISRYLPSGLINTGLGIISILGIACSIIQLLVGKKVYALIVFLITLPFTRFIELQAMYSKFSGTLLGPFIVTPTNIVILTFVLCYLIRIAINEQSINLSFDLGIKLYLAFVLFCLISTLFSSDISTSFIGFIVEVLIFPFFFFLVKDICKDERSVLHIFYGVVGYVSLRLIFSLYMSIRYKVAVGSLYLALNQIEVLTTISTMAIPLSIGLLILSNTKIIKLSAVIVILTAFFGIVFGDKREPIIALSLTMPFILFFQIRYKKIMILFAIISILGLILSYSISYQTHLSDIPLTFERIRSDSIRLSAWIASFGILKDYPLFGIGFGNFVNFLDLYAPRSYYSLNVWPLVTPHNYMLHYLTSVGLFASSCLFILIGYVYVQGIKIIRRNQYVDIKNLTIAILWSFTSFFVAANVGGTMVPFAYSKDFLEARIVRYMLDFGMLFWLFMGVINRIYSLEINSKKSLRSFATIGNR